MKLKILIICIMVLALAFTVYLSFDKIVIYTLSKFYGINISYTALINDKASGYSFENLKIFNKRMGLGFFSARAKLKVNKTTSFLKSLDIDFKFKDVHFIRNRSEESKTMYDSLNKVVAIPFEGRWTYKDVCGTIEIFSNGLTLKNLVASGSQIRLSLSGDVYYDNKVDADITIYFSKDVLKDIPQELHSVVMRDEPQEWKSFSVKMQGDYRKPSLQITGKLFRLNVGTMVMKD